MKRNTLKITTGFLLSLIIIISLSSFTGCDKEAIEADNKNTEVILPDITGYPIVETNQSKFYNNSNEINSPSTGSSFYGQDAHYTGNAPRYKNNGDGTITDLVTGLMWSKSADLSGDGDIDVNDKLTASAAENKASTFNLAGYNDWRLPTIKELYSLIMFNGEDVSPESTSASGLQPFIDNDYFEFAYGDTDAGQRIIDAQYASSTYYVDKSDMELLFGVNFADGRIKGYGLQTFNGEKTFYVLYVRGNTSYGQNDFKDNGDGTITDNATGLMWMQDDNGVTLNWEDALDYAEDMEFAGYSDWRLPNAKELQSIVDYSRSPGTTNSAAIDPVFNCTEITNEAGQKDFHLYWTSTTHASSAAQVSGSTAAYISFGRALGYMGSWIDIHGAGAQRSDPKAGDPDDYPQGRGPQGDVIRIYNAVRLVRDVN